MELKCVNKKCLHEWKYKGKVSDDKALISCPKCHYRNPLGKLKSLTHSYIEINNSLTISKKNNDSLTHSSKFKKEIKQPQTEIIESTKHFGEVKEIKTDIRLKPIPYDPWQHIQHMKEYGL